MQHDVDHIVLATLAGMVAAPTQRGPGDLEVTAFHALTAPAVSMRRSSRPSDALTLDVAGLRWAEQAPPRPRTVQAHNPGTGPVVVDAGMVLDGGMSARAVTASVVVAPGGWTAVAVEPVGARWWDEGRLRWRGRLEPVTAALVLQGAVGDEPASASARTAAWSLPVAAAVLDVERMPGTRAWVVSDLSGVVAAWVAQRGEEEAVTPTPPLFARGASARPRGAGVLDALAVALVHRRVVAMVSTLGRRWRDLVVVPRDTRLVDAVLRSSRGAGR